MPYSKNINFVSYDTIKEEVKQIVKSEHDNGGNGMIIFLEVFAVVRGFKQGGSIRLIYYGDNYEDNLHRVVFARRYTWPPKLVFDKNLKKYVKKSSIHILTWVTQKEVLLL